MFVDIAVAMKFLIWRESIKMKSLVYECDVEWLRPLVEGGWMIGGGTVGETY